MNITLLKGYPDFIGKRAAWAGFGSGPSSYATGGDPIALPLANYYIDTIFSSVYTVSGNYQVIPIASGVGARQTWKLKWLPAAQSDADVPLGLSAASTASSTLSAVSSVTGVGTITIANTLKAGQFVVLTGFTQLGALNGMMVQVTSATPAAFTFALGSAVTVASGADTTGKYSVVQAGTNNLLQVGAVATITNSLATASLLTMTCANTFVPGNFVVIQGLTNGQKANGWIGQVTTASATQFTANWAGTGLTFTTAADSGTASLLATNGNAPIQITEVQTITNSLATASSAGTAGVVTLTAANMFTPGNIVNIQGLTNGAASNGSVLTVISTALTNALFKANAQVAAYTSGADAGIAGVLGTGAPTGVGEVIAGANLSGEQIQLGGFCGQY